MDAWWKKAIIYQVYPKSFKDSNKDGIGDIPGLIEKLDYLKNLGVNTLWLNPIFMSPQVDNGYDVQNYFAIDERFGTLEDVERLIAEAHQRDLKIIFDFVLNHTSDQHPWFQEAVNNKQSHYRDYYYFTEEKPNNWGSFFGGPAFSQTTDGSYYFHLFAKEMPDLNWTNAKVRAEMLEVARFWAKKGIDGLRLDAFIHLAKADFHLQKEPASEEAVIAEEYYANLPAVHRYMQEFHQKLKAEFPDLFLLGEASSASVDLAQQYVDPQREECDAVISFTYFPEQDAPKYPNLPTRFQKKRFLWEEFAHIMDEWQEKIGSLAYPTLYWNNHDMARLVSRFGSEQYRSASAKCLATLMYLQKGIPILLYGEELGMLNYQVQSLADIEESEAEIFYQKAQQVGLNEKEILQMMQNHTRNASRGGMQWDASAQAGFTEGTPWLGVNEEANYNVAVEENDQTSVLHYYRRLLALKGEELFQTGEYERLHCPQLYAYARTKVGERAEIYCNIQDQAQSLPLLEGETLLSSGVEERAGRLYFAPWACLVKKKG